MIKSNEYSSSENLQPGSGWKEEIFFEDPELNRALEAIIAHPEAFIGEGGAGKVYVFRDSCIKLVVNRHDNPSANMFNLGNSIETEFDLQRRANELGEVSGVFTPAPYKYHKGPKTNAFVMEKLDAVDMQQVFMGRAELPSNFNLKTFFDALNDYVQTLNEHGILHYDIELRNIMIDRVSGLPRLIDYGRAKFFPNGLPKKMEDIDFNAIEDMYDKFQNFLTKK